MPRPLPEKLESLETEDEQEECLKTELSALEASMARQTEACFALEAEIKSLYEQRYGSARRIAPRNACDETDPMNLFMHTHHTGGIHTIPEDPNAPSWAAAAARASVQVDNAGMVLVCANSC